MTQKRILVVGDIMLDQYHFGEVKRVLSESYTPVVRIDNSVNALGGAANVAQNLNGLGTRVFILGIVGIDDAGQKVKKLLKQSGIDLSYLVKSKRYKMIEKIRIMGDDKCIVRIDKNDVQTIENNEQHKLIDCFLECIKKIDSVVISDYNKGVCSRILCKRIIEECNKKNIPVFVDPKGKDWSKYAGATMITPNTFELAEYLQCGPIVTNQDIENKMKLIYETLKIPYLLVTRAEKGMSLIETDMKVTHFDSLAETVCDVSGAGDTVIATLAAYYGETYSVLKLIEIANAAAGVVVAKFGTVAISIGEMKRILEMIN